MSDLNWRKSTYSDSGGNCVEVAETASVTHVRDSKDIRIPGFAVGNEAWTALVEYAKTQRV